MQILENLTLAHLKESEPNHHLLRAGWSVASTTFYLGNDSVTIHFSFALINFFLSFQAKNQCLTVMEETLKFLKTLNSKTMGCLSNLMMWLESI